MSQALRASSSMLARYSSRSFRVPRRTFTVSSAVRLPDLIQDLYLKELKAYKPPPVKPSDAEGSVQKFSPPSLPKSPEESNLASEMKAYEDAAVEVEGQAVPGETQKAEDDYFEDLKVFDEEPAHH